MYPWLWIWVPRFQYPWSGDVAQDIDPDTTWFFGSIKPEAGNARIEQKAFAVASYGKQLGLITEVLIGLAEPAAEAAGESARSLQELKRIKAEIEDIKEAEYERELLEIEWRITTLQKKGGKGAAALSKKLQFLAANSEAEALLTSKVEVIGKLV
jgi:hypothetical protein